MTHGRATHRSEFEAGCQALEGVICEVEVVGGAPRSSSFIYTLSKVLSKFCSERPSKNCVLTSASDISVMVMEPNL